jgi:hypothetical protein
MLAVGTRNAAGRRACHAQARRAVLGPRRRAWQGRTRLGDLSNAEWSNCCCRPAADCRLRPYKKSAGLPSPDVPADILSAGLPAAHRPTPILNGFGPGERVRERGRTYRSSLLHSHSYFLANLDLDRERLVPMANEFTRRWDCFAPQRRIRIAARELLAHSDGK